MAVPASYTETQLAQYMHNVLGGTATALAYTAPTSDAGIYAEAVNETLLAYGTIDISTITGANNIRKVRALARVQAWQKVVNDTAQNFNFDVDGGKYDRSQVHKQALENLELAKAEAAQYDDAFAVGVDRVVNTQDPYTYLPDEARVAY